jgi:hypothetical protein
MKTGELGDGKHRISGLDWQEMSETTREQVSLKLQKDIDALRAIRSDLQSRLSELMRSNRMWQILTACLGTLSLMLILFIILGGK